MNRINDYNREVLAIEVDTSLRAERVIRVRDRLKADRRLPHIIRVDNGPEFLAQSLLGWGKANRVDPRRMLLLNASIEPTGMKS